MLDANEKEIAINDIVKHENFKTGEVGYFYVDKDDLDYLWFYKYNVQGQINKNGLSNIKFDSGINLINNNISKWTIAGSKEEVYNKIFNELDN